MSGLQPGTIVDGKFRLGDEVGRGGMGVVYRAQQLSIEREVAIKVLQADVMSDPRRLKRFRREAHVISILDHPNIVHVFAIGFTCGQPYIAMEFLPGEQLSDRIAKDGPMPWKQAIPLFLQICDALQYAHDNQVIHRDIKPSNIALINGANSTDTAKLVDFGISKITADGGVQTQTDAVVGSILYTSPGQFAGGPASVTSDIYALGCTFYEVLAGKPAFAGDTVYETIQNHLNAIPIAINEANPKGNVPDDLDYLIGSMLRKDPSERPPTVSDVRSQLQNVLAGVEIARSVSTSAPPRRRPRVPIPSVLLFAAFAISFGLLSYLWFASHEKPNRAGAPTDGLLLHSRDPEIVVKEQIMIQRIKQKSIEKKSSSYANELHALATLYITGGLLLEAEQLELRAQKVALQSHAEGLSGNIEKTLADIYIGTGRLDKAVDLLKTALHARNANGDSTTGLQITMLDIYTYEGEYEKAASVLDDLMWHTMTADEAKIVYPEAIRVYTAVGNSEKSKQFTQALRELAPDLMPDTRSAKLHALAACGSSEAVQPLSVLIHQQEAVTMKQNDRNAFRSFVVLRALVKDYVKAVPAPKKAQAEKHLKLIEQRINELVEKLNRPTQTKLPV